MSRINGNSINSSPNWSGKANRQRIFFAYKTALPCLFSSRRTKLLSPVDVQGQITTFVKGAGLEKAQATLREISNLIRTPFFLGTKNNPGTEPIQLSPSFSGDKKQLSQSAMFFLDKFLNNYFVVEDAQALEGSKVIDLKQTENGELDIRIDYHRADIATFTEVLDTFLVMLQYNCFELRVAE